MHLFLLEVVVILKKSEATTTTSLEEQKQAFSQKSNILYFHYKTLHMQIIVADVERTTTSLEDKTRSRRG